MSVVPPWIEALNKSNPAIARQAPAPSGPNPADLIRAAFGQQMGTIDADYARKAGDLRALGVSGDEALAEAYSALERRMQGNLLATQNAFANAQTGVNQGFDYANQQAQAAGNFSNDILGRVSNAATLNNILGQSQVAQAASQGSLSALGTSSTAAAQQAQSDAAAEGASRRGDLQSQIGADLAALLADSQNQKSELQAQLMSALADQANNDRSYGLQERQQKMAEEEYRQKQMEEPKYAGLQGAQKLLKDRGAQRIMNPSGQNLYDQFMELYSNSMTQANQINDMGTPNDPRDDTLLSQDVVLAGLIDDLFKNLGAKTPGAVMSPGRSDFTNTQSSQNLLREALAALAGTYSG